MPPAPTVRDLNGLIQTIGQSIVPLKDQIDTDIAANEKYGEAQVAGLEAKKTRAFGDIEQAAQNKGMFFSGFSPDAQATYTADTYLPALASLQQTIAQTRSGLMKEKLGLDKDVFDKAFSSQESDRAILADWNKMTAQQQFEATEAEKQRVWQAQQNEQDRATQLSSARISNAGSSAPQMSVQDKVRAMLDAATGDDGKVNPGVWQNVAAYAANNGLNFSGDKGFASQFWNYANESHWGDYLGDKYKKYN